jgi:hypothetical protein
MDDDDDDDADNIGGSDRIEADGSSDVGYNKNGGG